MAPYCTERNRAPSQRSQARKMPATALHLRENKRKNALANHHKQQFQKLLSNGISTGLYSARLTAASINLNVPAPGKKG